MRKEKTIIKLWDLTKERIEKIDLSTLGSLNDSLPPFVCKGRSDTFNIRIKEKEKYNYSLTIPLKSAQGHRTIQSYSRGFLEMIEYGYSSLIDTYSISMTLTELQDTISKLKIKYNY